MSEYKVGEFLGAGGFGAVHKAYKKNKLYVLKYLKNGKLLFFWEFRMGKISRKNKKKFRKKERIKVKHH